MSYLTKENHEDIHVIFFSSRRRHTRWNCDWSRRVLFRSIPSGRDSRTPSAASSWDGPPKILSKNLKSAARNKTATRSQVIRKPSERPVRGNLREKSSPLL